MKENGNVVISIEEQAPAICQAVMRKLNSKATDVGK